MNVLGNELARAYDGPGVRVMCGLGSFCSTTGHRPLCCLCARVCCILMGEYDVMLGLFCSSEARLDSTAAIFITIYQRSSTAMVFTCTSVFRVDNDENMRRKF